MTKKIKTFIGVDIGKGESKIKTVGMVQMDGTFLPVKVTRIEEGELGLDRVCDSLLINELETRGYTLKKELELNHIERMELELEELSEKIEKGQQFLDKEKVNPKFTDETQIFFLSEQLIHMVGYREALRDRIKYDSKKNGL